MSKRKGISNSMRFEIFKRDSFACQYCGKKAPDVILEIDHIQPVAQDGETNILNLITSCRECNSGKSDKLMSQTVILDKQRKQLEDLQERKSQLEMIFEWQKGLDNLISQSEVKLKEYWEKLVPGYSLMESGIAEIKNLTRKYSIIEILEAMNTAAATYLKYENKNLDKDSVCIAFDKIKGVCYGKKMEKENPGIKNLWYARAIVRKRLEGRYCDDHRILNIIKEAVDRGVSHDSIVVFLKKITSWTHFNDGMSKL